MVLLKKICKMYMEGENEDEKKNTNIAAALCIAGCMVCIPDYSEADAASGYVVENLDRVFLRSVPVLV